LRSRLFVMKLGFYRAGKAAGRRLGPDPTRFTHRSRHRSAQDEGASPFSRLREKVPFALAKGG